MADDLNNSAVSQEDAAPPPGLLICDHFRRKSDYRVFRPNGTRDWLLAYTLSGEGRFRTAGDAAEHICRAGDFRLLKPGTMHDYATGDGGEWEFLWTHFVPPASWMPLLLWRETTPGLLEHDVEPGTEAEVRIRATFGRMIADSRGLSPLGERLAMNALEEILLLLAQRTEKGERRELDSRVEQVLRVLEQDLTAKHTVDGLAARVHLSSSRLAHLFKKQTGDSLLETYLKMRLRHASRLLLYTDRPIAEIAGDTGFPNPFYFSEQFTAFFGCSPTAYRARFGPSRPPSN
ncbi:helix-turn-helix domain-containing protein [Paenibacillus filicis]|uniref:Helix-turn-helix domain-containing protein n=1 Tax=Paenibacillus gyeongsangnamensis TaxID=3388067 RepID=A0ABT4QFT3_9BACL|nr:helix-turn-helix domain-containing protein [Paenibacillus filicis]MCZ8515726.1 helix-turn-helix domain-containing protein [Paenibacillus filicis]